MLAQAVTEQEVAVARCRSSAAAALDNARAHAENRCERLEESFARERHRAAVADLVLADMGAQLREEQAMLHQARLHVSRGSDLAEQQQRQLESDAVEPLLERFGTLRMKAVSDPFRERSLVCKSSMPAAPEQAYGVCGPETSVADAGVEAVRWGIPSPRDVNITDEDSCEESIGEERDRRRAVVKPIDLGRPPTGTGFQSWLAELYVNCCAASIRSRRRTMRFLKAVEKASTHKTLEVCSRKWERFDAELAAAFFFDSHLVRCFASSIRIEILFSGGV